MKSLWDVYIMVEDRVVTVVANVVADNECDARREAGVALTSRKNVSQLLFRAGQQLIEFGKIFEYVPHSCKKNEFVTLRTVTYRKVAI